MRRATSGRATSVAACSIFRSRAWAGSRSARASAFPATLALPEQLIEVQHAMKAGDPRARAIYETIGVCFGYAIAHYADFYEVRNLLVLGRVTSGEGRRDHPRARAAVLKAEFPALAETIRLRTPDEKNKRHGQAVSAAAPAVPFTIAAAGLFLAGLMLALVRPKK
jgi:predicted NBD/HSP70 family sugar kinase